MNGARPTSNGAWCRVSRARAWVCLILLVLVGLALGAPAASADPLGQITEFSAGLSPDSLPGGIAAGPDGNLWFTDAAGAIGRITPSGQITEFSAGLNPRSYPIAIAPGADGNLWFTDSGMTAAIGRITPSGQITEFSAGLTTVDSNPQGIAPGADGNLWFTDDATTPAIGRITPSGQITEFSGGLNPDSSPFAIAAGPDGNLWFTDEGNRPAIGRITPSGQITEFSAGLNPQSQPEGIAVGPDGNLWFTDEGNRPAIGRITPSGQITEFSAGLNPDSSPDAIAAGPDGNLWFADEPARAVGEITPSGQITEFPAQLTLGSDPEGIAPGADGNLWFTGLGTIAIGRVGTGAPPALQAPASVTGTGRPGSPETCQAQWSDWAGYSPFAALYSFDGYVWLRDGSPIAGQTAPTYTPPAADVGHQLACRATVTYPLPFQLTATATSPAITIGSALSPPPPPSTPVLSALDVSPRTFTLRGHRVGGRCEPASRSNRGHRACTRRAGFTVRFTLSQGATVTLTIERALPGRLTRHRCAAFTRADRHRPYCTRLVTLPGTIGLAGFAGPNAFTFTAATGGHALAPGRYRLLATPTGDGRTGNQAQTTFYITR